MLRNGLCINAADRGVQEETTRKLAEQKWRDMNYCAQAETGVIRQILARAGLRGVSNMDETGWRRARGAAAPNKVVDE